jgi:hypothetical protein
VSRQILITHSLFENKFPIDVDRYVVDVRVENISDESVSIPAECVLGSSISVLKITDAKNNEINIPPYREDVEFTILLGPGQYVQRYVPFPSFFDVSEGSRLGVYHVSLRGFPEVPSFDLRIGSNGIVGGKENK